MQRIDRAAASAPGRGLTSRVVIILCDFGGEAWRTGPNEITINAASGAFGYNRRFAESLTGDALVSYKAAMQARFERAAQYFHDLGFEVKAIPLTER